MPSTSSVPGAPETPSPKLLLITVTMMCASIMPALDMTVANVALPHMQGALSASQEQIAWVLTTYAVATAICMPLSGWLAERYGRSKVMLWSVAGFTIVSVFCGLAQSLPQIVIGRLLQGALGAGLIPLAQAVIVQNYPAHRMRRGLAIWSSGTLMAPILGPTVGGLLTDSIGWPWVFYINVPFGILAFIGILSYLPKDPPNPTRRLDFFGFATLTIAVGALQALLDRGQHLDWFDSIEIRIEACAALIATCFFITHTLLTRGESFFDKRLIGDRNYASCLIGMAVGGGILSASRALFPLMLQGLFLYSAFNAGMMMGPSGIGSLVAVIIYARWANAVDNRIFITFGLFLVGFSLWSMTGYNLEASGSSVAWPNLFQGMGVVLFMSPMTALAFTTLPHNLLNEGGTIFYLARNIGGSFAISITQVLFVRSSTAMHASLAEHVTPYTATAGALPGLDAAPDVSIALLNAEVTRQAAMIGYLDTFVLMLMVCIAVAPMILLLRMPKQRGQASSPQLVVE